MQGYLLGPAQLQFQINVTIEIPSAGGGTPTVEVLSLSPSLPVAASAGRTVAATLQGDLAQYTQLPVLRWELGWEAGGMGGQVEVGGAPAAGGSGFMVGPECR